MAMTELLASGVELMLVGMGIVYLFLAMLIGAIHVMASLVGRFFPEPLPLTDAAENAANPLVDQKHIAAISAAIHQYRIKHK